MSLTLPCFSNRMGRSGNSCHRGIAQYWRSVLQVYSFSLNLPVELFSPIAWLSLTLTGLPTPPLRAWQWTKLWTTLLWPTQAPTKWSPCRRTPSPSLETRALMTMASLATSGHSAQAAKGRWWRCRYERMLMSPLTQVAGRFWVGVTHSRFISVPF